MAEVVGDVGRRDIVRIVVRIEDRPQLHHVVAEMAGDVGRRDAVRIALRDEDRTQLQRIVAKRAVISHGQTSYVR
jgi:hypothetical protein